MNRVNIHLGVHKTATTFIQQQISNASIVLERDNVRYIDFPNDRDRYTWEIHKLANQPFVNTSSFLKELDLKGEDIIISDENILSGVDVCFRKKLYPRISSRVNFLNNCFESWEVVYHIMLRRPDQFFPSMYCEYLRHHKFIDFSTYVKNYDIKEFSWYQQFKDLIATNKDKKFIISDFDWFVNNKENYISQLTFNIIKSLDENIKPSRKSITKEAIQFLKKVGDGSNNILEKMEDSNYIYGNKFSPYEQLDIDVSSRSYVKDLVEFSKFDNVTLNIGYEL